MAKSVSRLLGMGLTKWMKQAGADGFSSAAKIEPMV
jgi:hypothetical protein